MVWSRWLDESNQMGSADASGQEQVEQHSRTSVVHPGTSQRGCLHIVASFRSCLEMTSGFLRGKPENGATLTGFVYSDFNANPGGRKPSRGSFVDARIPGFGAV
jgi:hypothetical protein